MVLALRRLQGELAPAKKTPPASASEADTSLQAAGTPREGPASTDRALPEHSSSTP
jgi:hypothetical protein